jgi:hypothetical protein
MERKKLRWLVYYKEYDQKKEDVKRESNHKRR